MTIEVADHATTFAPAPRLLRLADHWPLLAGLAAMAVPTFARLGQQSWSTEAGAHGPLVLATGLWLLVQHREELEARRTPASPVLLAIGLAVAFIGYAFGRAFDFLSIEAMGLYGCFALITYRLVGLRAMLACGFPFAYLLFMVPPPGWLIDYITGPLRIFVSQAAEAILLPFGYPLAREGVTLVVGQYQLLVEEACSGMNSLVGLTAIGLFYIHVLHRSSLRYSLFLLMMIVPIAIFVNILRVVALILMTYYFGDAVAQGFLHATTGVVLFGVAVGLIFLVDQLCRNLLMRRAGAASRS